MLTYDTVSAALDGLQARGYTLDFNLCHDHLHCKSEGVHLHPEDFHIEEVYRFEGDTDPADEAVVYALYSEKYKIKGTLVDGYGASASPASADMLAKLKRH
jgi:hypothetical protein